MAADVDSDVPDCGAAFTFGKSRFSENEGKFWIKEDPILQIACGDEHTALLTASGRLFTFGNNEWGQLGHGHTKTLTKPSCVKALKGERITVLSCGRSHTLVATASGHVYGFGSNSEGQLGSADEQPVHLSPTRVQGLEGVYIKMLSAGAEHSLALTEKGAVFVWGSGGEGQIGPERHRFLIPTELDLECSIISISAGYYHSAFVTVDGKLYMCGEAESGKLGLPPDVVRKSPLSVHCVPAFDRKVVWVSCGGNHTVVLTSDGKAYSFGDGSDGQLGLGSQTQEALTPNQILCLDNVRIARVSCGENHTAFLSDRGQLYTCGNGRHRKLGLLSGYDVPNVFVPTLVSRFIGFQVQQVSCGGCHTMVLAVRQTSESSQYSSPLSSNLNSSAREKRRKNIKNKSLTMSPNSAKNENFSPTLKAEYRQRDPALATGTVWYVSIDENTNETAISDEDDEVVTHLNQTMDTIRHVDSDVESDTSETPDLNTTHTLIRVNNTILVRPVSATSSVRSNEGGTSPDTSCENANHASDKRNAGDCQQQGGLISKDVKDSKTKKGSPTKTNEAMRSQFYDNEAEQRSGSISSKESKSSPSCVIA